MKKFKWALLITLSMLLLSSCGFHPRRAEDIPPQLHTLYVDSQQPYSLLVTQLKAMLRSLNVTIVNKASEAPYTLKLANIAFSQSNPPITTTSLAVTFTYALSVSVQIDMPDGKGVTQPKILNSIRSISQNPNQVYTPGSAALAKQELRRDIISQIYYVIVSNNTRNALSHVHKPT